MVKFIYDDCTGCGLCAAVGN
ncbi:4Fe-4S binding protein [Marinomonas primoryensis]